MSKPSAPPPPDYAALAAQQGAANKETAIFNTNANRANQVGPDGSLTWSRAPLGTNADGTPKEDDGSGWTQTTTLSPEQQQLHDMQMAISLKAGGAASGAVDRATAALANPMDTSNIPGISYGPQAERTDAIPLATALAPLQADPQRAAAAQAQAAQATAAGDISSKIDRSGVRALPGSIDDTSRRRVEEALLSRLNPSLQLDEDHLRNRLLNSGIEVGTDAYNRELALSGQKMNDARMQAILAGGQEESRQVGLTQGLQQQEFSQAQAQAAMKQAADAQISAQANAVAMQNAGLQTQTSLQNATAQTSVSEQSAALEAQRRQAMVDAGMQANQQAIGVAQQNFNQGLATSDAQNRARAQALQEEAALRMQPLNEVNAMRTGSQVTAPMFGSYYTGGTAQAAPVFDAGVAKGNYDMSTYQNQQSGSNALFGGLANLGSAWLKSDIRLKKNIVRIGDHPSGAGRYSWDWKDGSGSSVGVLAQELQSIHPAAVAMMPDGYLAVCYDMIGGQ